jgi:hypothetical protein
VEAVKLGQLGDHDRGEVEAFTRFLSEAGQVGPDNAGRIPREWPGWVPYCLGEFLEYRGGFTHMHPPEGYGRVPITAWTFPG